MWVSAKFVTCTVKGTLVEAKMCTFTIESTHFFFNKCPIHTQHGATAKFITNSQDPDYSVDSNLGCSSRQAWSINFFYMWDSLSSVWHPSVFFTGRPIWPLFPAYPAGIYWKNPFLIFNEMPLLPSNPLRKVETKAKACSREKFPNCHLSGSLQLEDGGIWGWRIVTVWKWKRSSLCARRSLPTLSCRYL